MKHRAVVLIAILPIFIAADFLRAQAPVRRPVRALQTERRADRLVAEGLALMRRGRTTLAQAKLQQALRLDPQNARAHLAYADLLLRENKTLAAYDHFTKAVKCAPADARDRERAAKIIARIRSEHPEWFSGMRPPNSAQSTPRPGHEPSPDVQTAVLPPLPNGFKPTLAVLPFEAAGGDSTLGLTFSEMVATALIMRGTYRIVERRQIEHVLQEQALGQTGALETETAVAVGKILGVQAITVGNLSRLNAGYESDARVLNVESGEALLASHARAASPAQFREAAESIAADLSAKVGNLQRALQPDSTAGRAAGQ
ncbi:MAG: tetratricopeptide repeat protein [candidate division KSB1 bacterium]|nr:tetratricopeptide repeat protein [candidate division KSB1 bacterium]MDZ7273957.1 tetratricopeptide repeat protein [candidate division KSB1 bacterium]MDZ7286113.1 tetratricopeptide repeat protein [candidate division KSB1 bacterium]MDZ7299145.1 tetratricopeptide repeat protein [candidate division KSB1 bacterium]MDZ7308342.1 tetratricopeptide repeat protein [candidate division KSB1 bacterium]